MSPVNELQHSGCERFYRYRSPMLNRVARKFGHIGFHVNGAETANYI